MMKKIAAVAALILAALVLPATAAHAYGEFSGPNAASTGSTYVYEITGLEEDTCEVFLTVLDEEGDSVGSGSGFPVEGDIAFDVEFPSAGEYTLIAEQPGCAEGFVDELVVTVTAPPSDIATTGFEGGALVWFGGGALILGIALVVVMAVARRNRQTTTV